MPNKRICSLLARLLAVLCLFTLSAHGQAGDFAPQQTASSPLQLRISDGSIGGGVLGTFQFKSTNVLLTANATNYVYLDLTTSPPTLTVNTTGFPTTACYKIATAVTGAAQITSLADSRPTFNSTIGSSSSSPSSPAPPMGYYLSSACKDLGITNPFCFGTPANTQQANLCTYTSASTAVTCRTQMPQATAAVLTNVATYTFPANVIASWAVGNSITVTGFSGGDAFFNQTCTLTAVTAQSVSCALVHANASSSVASFFQTVTNTSAGPFTAFDAGTGNPNGAKRIWGYASCQADSGAINVSSNSPMVTAVTTVSAFVSSLQVTISGSALNSSGANTGCVIWGNPDDTAAAAMDLAMLSATQCPRAHMAAAYYLFTVPHFYLNPYSCFALPSQEGAGLLANLIYAAGFEWDGRGVGTTVVYLPPGFPESGPGCVNGGSKKACFVVQTEGRVSNIMITGGGNYASANFPAATNLVEVDGPATLEYFTCHGFGAGTGSSVGLAAYNWAQLSFINISACGDESFATSQSTVSITAYRMSIENPRSRAFGIGELTDYASQTVSQFNRYNFICNDCYALNQNLSGGAAIALMRISGALHVKLLNYRASKYLGGLAVNGAVGLQLFTAGAGLLDIQDSFLDMTAGGTSSSTGDIGLNDQGGYIVHMENTIVKGTSGGNAYTGVAASKFNSLGGNILGGMSINAAGLLSLMPTDDLSVATGVTPTCPTVTGATATCAPVAGSTNEKGTLRMTVSAAGTAAGTVTMNFVGAFSQSNTPSCNFNWANTGTGAWNARAATWLSTRSSTAPVISWDNNAVALGNLTWDIDYSCKVQ